jgi:LmbE family N-acetylglucosaminyl deacetylase
MRILAIGAHPDDVELGCGATLAKLAGRGAVAHVLVMTDGSLGPSGYDSRHEEQAAAAALLGASLIWGGHRDGELALGPKLISWLGDVIEDTKPDLVFTHTLSDSHQDHVVTAQATLAAARHLPQILHFETPSTLAFQPTVFCDVDGAVEHKLNALRCHLSQVVSSKRVDIEAVEAQLRFRGFQSRGRFAEGFESSRCLLVPRDVVDISEARSAVEFESGQLLSQTHLNQNGAA